VDKGAGDAVIGGAINGAGSLRIEVTATGEDTALAGIMGLVREAQESKSNTQLLADRASGGCSTWPWAWRRLRHWPGSWLRG
jgi:Cu2+-exporting ATPase